MRNAVDQETRATSFPSRRTWQGGIVTHAPAPWPTSGPRAGHKPARDPDLTEIHDTIATLSTLAAHAGADWRAALFKENEAPTRETPQLRIRASVKANTRRSPSSSYVSLVLRSASSC